MKLNVPFIRKIVEELPATQTVMKDCNGQNFQNWHGIHWRKTQRRGRKSKINSKISLATILF